MNIYFTLLYFTFLSKSLIILHDNHKINISYLCNMVSVEERECASAYTTKTLIWQ